MRYISTMASCPDTLQCDIDAPDRQMDSPVYQPCGPTDDEIRIVEEATP
jgi:hypothetical protein